MASLRFGSTDIFLISSVTPVVGAEADLPALPPDAGNLPSPMFR